MEKVPGKKSKAAEDFPKIEKILIVDVDETILYILRFYRGGV
jgi:hypothetical protein